jgi:hypothetical protein
MIGKKWCRRGLGSVLSSAWCRDQVGQNDPRRESCLQRIDDDIGGLSQVLEFRMAGVYLTSMARCN